MPLHVHRATRTDLLAEGLAAVLAVPAADPLAQEIVVVPARGVERWLTQRLSHRLGAGSGGADGVCAGVRFLSPNSLVTLLLGTDRDDPWLPDNLAWPLLATMDERLDEPWAVQLARHLGHGDASERGRLRAGRRYSVARRLAGLFHSYAVQRPALLASWEAGRPGDGSSRPDAIGGGSWPDGIGGTLDADLAWQPPLWRALIERIGGTTPVERHTQTVMRLRDGDPSLDLPERMSLFGHTRLARTEIELLSALGERHQVDLWLPHPSPALWAKLMPLVGDGPVPRDRDESGTIVAHPLLASLGRDLRELQRAVALASAGDEARLHAEAAHRTDPDHASAGERAESQQAGRQSWLAHLQHDLATDHPPTRDEARARAIGEDDRSIQIHACHGPARQVEVLRDVLVGLLADDPSLEPRDILVMCPDIETFAPLIQAAFGLADLHFSGETHPAHGLRVQLADRSRTATNPLLAVAARLVDLSGGRITASEILDLAATVPVRARFAFSEDDLEQFGRWVEQSGVRWGLDGGHRTPYGLGGLAANTWRAGLDRILLGVARTEEPDHWVRQVLPLDDVDSGSIDLAGRVNEFVDRVDAIRDALLAAGTVRCWTAALADGVDALAEVPRDDAWQRAELGRELATVAARADPATLLHVPDVRALLTDRAQGRPTRANFRTGGLTVCTMVPMRSVPHRVVALLGLDDGTFPRGGAVDGDDALARHPVTGERDVRSEDRQLLLDAICAARDTLVVTYTGADPHTGAVRAPAVPLGEVIDAARAARGLGTSEDDALLAPVRRHRLQPFDAVNLDIGAGPAFSFDPHALAAAKAARTPRPRPAPGLQILRPLTAPPREDVDLADLQDFFANPTRAFLRDRLDVGTPLEADPPRDAIPIDLDGLATWQVGDRLLRDLLAGGSVSEVQQSEYLRGELPPAALGQAVLRAIGPVAQAIAAEAEAVLRADGTPLPVGAVDIDVDLGEGRRLTGTVGGVAGRAALVSTYSRIAARHRLQTWITLLALTAGTPPGSGPWTAHAVGRAKGVVHVAVGPIERDAATQVLRDLVAVRDRGQVIPIPFCPKTSHAYAATTVGRARATEEVPLIQARKEWLGSDRVPGERADVWVTRLYGDHAPLDVLLRGLTDDERWPGPHALAGPIESRLGHYAMRIWAPALVAGIGR